MSNFKPLLAATYSSEMEPRFPYLASPKLDGIRCVIRDGVALSRTLKPIPNKYIQSILGNPSLNGFDGEIIVGSATHPECFRNTSTVVMSHDKIVDDFTYYVFDHTEMPTATFTERNLAVFESCLGNHINTEALNHVWVRSEEELESRESEYLDAGFEGLMLRDPTALYKHGRSTLKQQTLIKVKRFADSEAIVLGFDELEHNENEKAVNELGRSKRSSHQDGKVLAGTLGALRVRDIVSDFEFNIGTGLTAQDRQTIWDNQQNFVGKLAKYKFFPVGIKDKPRHPVFLGWRSNIDIGEVA
jgi:DNA ligase-1